MPMRWEAIVDQCENVHDAIRFAEQCLPGEASDAVDDPRWQSIIAVGEFIRSDPEPIWAFVFKWGQSPDNDLQDAIACCLLEHLLEHHFQVYFERVREATLENREFAETFQRCWDFGASEEPENKRRLDELRVMLAGKYDG